MYSVPYSDRKEIIDTKHEEIQNICRTFHENFDSKLVVTSLQIPSYSPYGISEGENYGLKDIIYKINLELFDEFQQPASPKVFIYDFNEFVSKFGENNIFNYKQFFSGDIKISTEYIPKFINELMGYVYAVSGITKKCIVLDLDNTLWLSLIHI